MRKQILILGHNDATQFIDIYNQYTRLFDKNEYEVTVALLTGESSDQTRQRIIADNLLFLNFSKQDIRTLKIGAIKKLLALCREKHFDIVICHRYKPSYIMLWAAQFHKIPALIFVMHELGTMASPGRRMLTACLARKNMLFAGVSNAVRDDMRKDLCRVPQDRIITLYNMIDVDMTEPHLLSREQARAALNLPGGAFVFGTVGRLAVNKDQQSLIHAFALIKPHCPNAKLVIIGDGELEAQLKEQVKTSHLSDDVIFTGFLPAGFRYMKAFDSFVLSSIQEAFGRVLLEAMIARLPIIATSVNGIPEVVNNAGVLVKPKDFLGLAAAMREIYAASPAIREQKSDKAYQRAIANFSIPRFQEQFWQLPLIQSIKG